MHPGCAPVNDVTANGRIHRSIPQKNLTARLNAINSLGVFSSLMQHFVIIAPPTVHRDTALVCDKASYSRRGWCRLEQWGHMCMWGMQAMNYYNAKTKRNEPLDGDASCARSPMPSNFAFRWPFPDLRGPVANVH